ncbi:MAG TPA: response regulator [Planctomycetota bacterium]
MKPKRLLIIEDDSIFRNILVLMVAEKYVVMATRDRDSAVNMLETGFDVVLMDMQMPGMEAEDFMARLREDCPGAQVVLMSGYCNSQVANELGVRHFLSKPFTLDQLHSVLKEADAAPVS